MAGRSSGVAALTKAVAAGQVRYGLVTGETCTAATSGKALLHPGGRVDPEPRRRRQPRRGSPRPHPAVPAGVIRSSRLRSRPCVAALAPGRVGRRQPGPCAATPATGAGATRAAVCSGRRSSTSRPACTRRRRRSCWRCTATAATGLQMERYSGLSAVADRYRFVVAYPSSSGTYWNSTAATGLPKTSPSLRRSAALQRRLRAESGVRHRRLERRRDGRAARAAISARRSRRSPRSRAATRTSPRVDPARPVSVLEIHGTADQVVPYFGPSPATDQ